MTDNDKLKNEILKKQAGGANSFTLTDEKGNLYIRSDKVMEALDSYHLARLEAITDEIMVTEMGESAEQQRITHNNQYGAYKLGFRSCYEWIIKKLSQ